jgi:polysaccharide pyruvyl transferase WcaK-like protein
MHQFVITAGAISGNKGTESMVAAVCRELFRKYPDCRIRLLSYYPKADKNLAHKHGIDILPGTPASLLFSTMPLALLVKTLGRFGLPMAVAERNPVIRAILKADMVFDVGGITFSDGREIYLPFNILTLLPAILLNRPVVKLSQAMGPFSNPLNRASARWILPSVDRIYARGGRTMAHLKEIGLTNIILAADLAFALETSSENRSGRLPIFEKDRRTVGIAPSSVVYKYCRKRGIDYIDIMARFVKALNQDFALNVLLIPHSIKKGTRRLKNNDLPVIRALESSVTPSPWLKVVDADMDIAEMRSLIGGCDFFVASRFHSMISALSEKTPMIVIGWGHKYLEALEQFDLAEFAVDYRHLDFNTILNTFRRVLLEEKKIRELIDRKSPEIIRSSRNQFHEIFSILDNRE